MKKLISTLLAVLMIFSSAIVVLAADKTAMATSSKEKTPYEVFYDYMLKLGYKESKTSGIAQLGKLGSGYLFYGSTSDYGYDISYTSKMIGGYEFSYSPFYETEVGLFVVKGNIVKTLEESYKEEKFDMSKVVDMLNSYDGHNFIRLYIYDDDKLVYSPHSTRILKSNYSVKAGSNVSVKLVNGTVKQWKVSNTKVAKINSKGVVTGLNKGKVTVTATLTNGKKLTCKATVTTAPKLSRTTVNVKKGNGTTVKVKGKVSNIALSCSKSNKKVLVYKAKCKDADEIFIVGRKKGTTTVKVKVNGVKTLNIKVNVK